MFFHESKWLKSITNASCEAAKKFFFIFRFIDDLIAVKHGNGFENNYNEICSPQLILKKENTSDAETAFLYMKVYFKSLYDERNSCNFKVVRLLIKVILFHQKWFFTTTIVLIFWSVKQLFMWYSLLKHLSFSVSNIQRRGRSLRW